MIKERSRVVPLLLLLPGAGVELVHIFHELFQGDCAGVVVVNVVEDSHALVASAVFLSAVGRQAQSLAEEQKEQESRKQN